MIAITSPGQLLLRAIAPFVWHSEAKIAAKLEGYAATEAGSALDMLKAAEITADPRLRRLFFRHAMDEARHARMFREQARQHAPTVRRETSAHEVISATRQNLLERLGLVRFIAFVYLAEKRGELQFRALQRHFRARPDLERLFGRISKDERFHVAYTEQLLEAWRRDGRGKEVREALLRVRLGRALETWRRSGRIFGELMSRLMLGLLYLVVLPLFAVVARVVEPPRTGWTHGARKQQRTDPRTALLRAGRQF